VEGGEEAEECELPVGDVPLAHDALAVVRAQLVGSRLAHDAPGVCQGDLEGFQRLRVVILDFGFWIFESCTQLSMHLPSRSGSDSRLKLQGPGRNTQTVVLAEDASTLRHYLVFFWCLRSRLTHSCYGVAYGLCDGETPERR
jgi:hypothetical protein